MWSVTAACEELRAQFAKRYSPLAPKAVERLPVDWERPITFYQFSQEHWRHLWTTNVVESPFAAMRLRATAAKRFKQVDSATAMLWKVLQVGKTSNHEIGQRKTSPYAEPSDAP